MSVLLWNNITDFLCVMTSSCNWFICFFNLPVSVLVLPLLVGADRWNFFVVISCRVNDAQSQPKREYTPKPRPAFDFGETENSNGAYSPAASSPPAYSPGKPTSVNSVIAVWVSLNVCVCEHVKDLLPRRLVYKWISLSRLMCLSFCDINQPRYNIQVHPSKEPRSGAERVSETDEGVSLTQN